MMKTWKMTRNLQSDQHRGRPPNLQNEEEEDEWFDEDDEDMEDDEKPAVGSTS